MIKLYFCKIKMRKKKITIGIGILISLFLSCFTGLNIFSNQPQKSIESSTPKISNLIYENATIISDGYNGVYWNDDRS